MAKEMLIIFVYDTQKLQKEEDDPSSAILYFHPSWVSEQQKTALCGQLMGTVHCIKSIFSIPKIISLQSGKFFVQEHGRYFMAIGTDRNISNWLLEHRAKTISSLINFFHENIEEMANICGNTAKLSTKLYQAFETYLKYLFFGGGNIFSYTPSIVLPKSASNVFLEAIEILQSCQELNYVLGGALFYHNKVVATQLSPDLTKRLIITDPYRIKSPAEIPKLQFDLPLGVQLLQVYISSKEFNKLHEESLKNRQISEYLNSKSFPNNIVSSKSTNSKEQAVSMMKRDQSIIFSSVPEEDSVTDNIQTKPEKPKTVQQRPKFLNLKCKTTDFALEYKKNPSNIFGGQTSVVSTPMTDLGKVIHSKPMSICVNPEVERFESNEENSNVTVSNEAEKTNKPHLNSATPYLKISNISLYDKKKFPSAFDVREKQKSINNSITMKYYNVEAKEKIKSFSDYIEDKYNEPKSITDPTYPIFNADGSVISHFLYEDYIASQMKCITEDVNHQDIKKAEKVFANFDSSCFISDNEAKIQEKRKICEDIEMSPLPANRRLSQEHRKSLTLPLSSLSQDCKERRSPINSYALLPTPLMSKFASFVPDERASSSEYRLFTPTQQKIPFLFKKLDLKDQKKSHNQPLNDEHSQKCILFVCGQQDTVVILLLEEEVISSLEIIKTLWEICTENLGKLEKQLHHSLETFPGTGTQNDGEPYSYLCLDSEWDTLSRGGPWESADLGALTYFHRDFKNYKDLTEILMRCCDGVTYGYQCGQSEIFYHQAANSNAGLPTPADPMGNVPLKAKRRLERDHSIILL